MPPDGKRCAYHKLASGIREFVFLEKSPQAVDEWIQHLNRIMRDDPPQPDAKELLLLDIRQHVPGAVYAARQLHAWRKRYQPDDDRTSAAVLLRNQAGFVLQIANNVVNIVGLERINLRLFIHDRQKAINWLLSQR